MRAPPKYAHKLKSHSHCCVSTSFLKRPPTRTSENMTRAARSGVSYVAQPGGSIRDEDVIDACNRYGMVMSFIGMRLFHH